MDVLRGSRQAVDFDEFYLATRGRLLGQLTAMTADPEQAADVLQEGYVRAWQAWPRVSRLDDPTAWVRKVSWRLAVSQHRRSLVAARVRHRLGAAEHAVAPADTAMDVQEALRRLPVAHRQVLVMHELCGMTVQEVADAAGVPSGTVKSRLFRARAALAELLGPEYDVPAEPVPDLAGPGQRIASKEERR
ncbi:MAG TPA: sigma-70 family RNA polymerase sigma factor [Nocardioidaceae bacterium]|nr:sigma-70 family RNA polymerase sigma factor [Nocardioidaceae bacterium]